MVVFSRVPFPTRAIFDGLREFFSIDSGGVGQAGVANGNPEDKISCRYCRSFGVPARVGTRMGYGCGCQEPR